MRLLPRDSTSLTKLASGLSLVIANYKPIPQLPSNSSSVSSSSSSGNSTNVLLPSGAHSFKTQPDNSTSPYSDASLWGVPSTLYIPDSAESSSGSNGNTLKASSTVGPGNCPLNTTTYKPTASLPAPTYANFDSTQASVFRYRQQVGVNLGGWFVQEAWMESDFMSCAIYGKGSEYALLSGFGTSAKGLKSARHHMEQHWDTWITESDFAYLASKGVNTVRLPIGYWSVGPYFCDSSPFEPYKTVYANSWRYVARAIRWAHKYDIGILIDLHGAYGSQNGQDHSGIAGKVGFYNETNMKLTTNVLTWMAHELAAVSNVIGIELLNEPEDKPSLWTWYNSTMNAMREVSKHAKILPLYFHDAFNLAKGAGFVSNRTDFVVQDDHSYFVYTSADTKLSADGHTKQIEGTLLNQFIKEGKVARRNLVIGEWSCALASSSLSDSSNPQADQKEYCEAQTSTYQNATSGYMFWSYKMENCASNAGWCFRKALGEYLPQYLNAWGFSGYTTNRKILLNLAAAKTTSAKIVSAISSLTVPGASNSASSTGATSAAASLIKTGNGSDTASSELAATYKKVSLASTGVKVAPLLDEDDAVSPANHNGTGTDASSSSTASAPTSSGNGTSTSASTSTSTRGASDRRGVGSLAARAAALAKETNPERRASGKVLLAQQAGFSDGYLTATYFASMFSGTTPLSRLGFAEQYMMDSWAVRVAWGAGYTAANYGHYKTHFQTGITAAESAIVQAVEVAPTAT